MEKIELSTVFQIVFSNITDYLDFEDIQNVGEALGFFPFKCNYKKIKLYTSEQLTFLRKNYSHFNYLQLEIFTPSLNLKLNPTIQSLTLVSQPRKTMPNIYNLKNLKHLSIINSQSVRFTQRLPKQLLTISLKDAQITKMFEINYLTRLQKLNLKFNYIKTIPFAINLPNLTYLNLSSNFLTEIPHLNTINLRELYLDINQISKIENIEYLSKLEILNLRDNLIEDLENLHFLKNLKFLNLSFNKVIEIGPSVNNLVNLRHLNLENNRVLKIKNVNSLKKLRKLNLSGNRIDVLENMKSLSSLVHIDLDHNPLAIYNDDLVKFPPSLEYLFTTHNTYTIEQNNSANPRLKIFHV